MVVNKKGITTGMLLLYIGVALIVVAALGVISFVASLFDDSFSQIDLQLGNISFNETYQQALKPALVSIETTIPQTMSLGILMGLIIVMMYIGFNTKRLGAGWIALDVLILIIAEGLAVLVKSGFNSYINSTPELFAVFTTTLSSASKFILNLPKIIPTVGILIMIATHFVTKDKEGEDVFT